MEHGAIKSDRIPPLESGARLTRHEFERRYTAIDKKRAYRRNGVKEYIVWQVLERLAK